MPPADPLPAGDDTPGRSGPDQRALATVALRARIRALTGGGIEVGADSVDPAVVGHVAGDRAFYQASSVRGLGPALRWAMSNEVATLDLIAEAAVAGDLARRAGHLVADGDDLPAITVWSADGPQVVPAEPSPLDPPPPLPPGHQRFASVVAESGARPVDDHGILVAEVAGLEVARVVDGDDLVAGGQIAGVDADDRTHLAGPQLAVGVGQADRELQDYLHGHLDDDTNLRRAIAAVVRHRNPGSAAHPLSRLSRQRWLRSVLLDDPSLVGLDELEPVPPLRPPVTLLSQEPVAARGSGAVVVCSVGVDLDLLPEAADYRHRDDPDAELIVVVPERDRRLVAGPLEAAVPRLDLRSIDAPWDQPGPR
ncbi:MAG: hypothetical protein AAGA93_03295 [Actinomycetota bacterium]